MGRPATCSCDVCAKCKHKLYMREYLRKPENAKKHRKRVAKRRRILVATDPEWLAKERARCIEKTKRYEGRWDACKRWRAKYPEKVRAHNLKRSPDHKTLYPEKYRARNLLANALRDLRISKPTRCEHCHKETPSRSLHGHHHLGYQRPLDVLWLCVRCHGIAHRKAA